jgi:glycine oxidase
MLALRRPGFTLKRVLRSKSGYLVPRSDGRIVAGSTIEEAGFEKRVTAAGIRSIIDTATELCPELNDAELLETWCGLRPGSPDALPILGPIAEGLIVATGTSFNAQPYSPTRFEASARQTAQLRS